MKARILSLVAALMMATPALAAWDVDAVTQQYVADGYTRVEVKIGPTQAKVEAIKDGTKLEVVYDLATGNVLKTETEAVESDDNTLPGVFVRNRSGDFVRTSDDSDDGDDDSRDDDDDSRDDDGRDDDSTSGSDDDSDDDDDADDDSDDSDDDSDNDDSDDDSDDSDDD